MEPLARCPQGGICYVKIPCGEPGSPFLHKCTLGVLPPKVSTHAPAPYDFSGLVDGSGYKASMDDSRKLPLWLVPVALIMAAGRALAHGAKKYASNNWRKGMAYSEIYSALQRHLTAWLEGEDMDPDSGLNHLDHATACIAFLTEYVAHPGLYGKFDDRFKRPSGPPAG
jgi:hypothetical protein